MILSGKRQQKILRILHQRNHALDELWLKVGDEKAKSNISNCLNKLISKGYVERMERGLYGLTRAGRKVVSDD